MSATEEAIEALARDLYEAGCVDGAHDEDPEHVFARWENMSDQSHARFRLRARHLLDRYTVTPAQPPLSPVEGVNPLAMPLDPRLRYIVTIGFRDWNTFGPADYERATRRLDRIVGDLGSAGVLATPLVLLPGETLAVHALQPEPKGM